MPALVAHRTPTSTDDATRGVLERLSRHGRLAVIEHRVAHAISAALSGAARQPSAVLGPLN